jgi:hypothetical protein
MPYGVGLKDERPTSNVQRRTSNNDVARAAQALAPRAAPQFNFIPFQESEVKP